MRHQRNSSSHVRSCPDCSAALHRERQYLERLRGAAIPPASDDLTARLLANTGRLAMAPSAPVEIRPHPARVFVIATGGAAAAAGLLAVTAFSLACDPLPRAGGPSPAAVLQEELQGQAAAGNLTGTQAVAIQLSADQLSSLRTEGWQCPELQAMGFHVTAATATVFLDKPALEMRLSDGQNYATVLEQHNVAGTASAGTASAGTASAGTASAGTEPAGGPAASTMAGGPVNVLTGHPASEDGFVLVQAARGALPGTGTASASTPGGGTSGGGSLWIKAAAPWTAIYQTSTTTFTYVSDLPPEQADDAVAALVSAGVVADKGLIAGVEHDADEPGLSEYGAESFADRVQRGVGRIMGLMPPWTGLR
ncbi:hypothetical protein [Pseudarthrobacter sp. N5]|uniref:hypothetical protein n=1 Tax=Pseudarthrobacter sp. N5 TaxID=3418416 RepID=UPI003CF32DCB